MIKKIYIQNFKTFGSFKLSLNDEINLIVGDNEAGKSTILEAVNLALTKKLNGRPVEYELSPFLFNKACTDKYLKALSEDKNVALPTIFIELFLADQPDLQYLRGANNSEKVDCVGLKIVIDFDEDYRDEYAKLLEKYTEIKVIPTEYYKAHWYSFANNAITARGLPVGLSYIDATAIRLQSGTDYYLHEIINNGLDPREKAELAIAYRSLKEQFSKQPSIKGINDKLTIRKGAITDKELEISIDISQKSNWETSLIPHLDQLPFQFIGKGEQNALKIMLALERQVDDAHVILIEEPENHLSFSSMNILIKKIRDKCAGKQILITTHSAFVLNKLGIQNVVLLNGSNATFLSELPQETQDYFRKLSGYDTLRLILAKKAILVEGPSDELVVQKAYLLKHGVLPIENGVDVINVRGLSFKRFLDIAKEVKTITVVVTDNDGNYQSKIVDKYKEYEGIPTITIHADQDNAVKTLEPQIAKINELHLLNKVLGTMYLDKNELLTYMKENKTECALKIFDTSEDIQLPQYVQDAVA